MKKFLSIFMCALLMFVSCFVVGAFALGPAMAETTIDSEDPPIQDGKSVITNHYADNINFSKSLYAILSRIYTESGNTLGQGGSFPTDAFNAYTTLDLTIGQGYLEDYPVDNKITSLVGLEHLSLNNLKTLKVDNHNIPTVFPDDLSSLLSLNTLYITNSNVEEINFPATMTKLNYLDLSGNKLTKINASTIANIGTDVDGLPYLSLSKNNFSKVSDITLPTSYPIRSLDVSFNNLVGVKAEDFNANNVSILLQGYNPDEDVVYGQKIYIADGFIRHSVGGVIQNDEIENLNAKVFFSENSSFYATMQDAVAETVDGYITIPCGKLTLKFYEGQTEITDIEVFEAVDKNVLPPTPSVKGFIGNQEITTFSSSDTITLKAELALTGSSLDPFIKSNCVIKMKVGANGDYEEVETLNFTSGGRYSVTTVITFDGLSSETVTSSVQKNDYTGLTWALIVVVIIAVIIISLFFLLRWVREGAVVAPLTDKEIRKVYQKQGKDYYVSDHRDLLEDGDTVSRADLPEENNYPTNNNDDDNEVIGL